jgi:polyribonucleotide nucleotidyltransferase
MLEAIKFAHEHIKIKFLLKIAAFGKKRSSYLRRRKRRRSYLRKSKEASYDKIYYSKGSSKQERTAAFEVKEVKALFTEEELAENGDLVSKYFKNQ